MNINSRGLDLIKKCEDLRLKAYLDSAGAPTIGYGHTGPDVRLGMTITEEEAERLLLMDVASAERAVTRQVRVTLTENQFSALVSFVFNVGSRALTASTLLRKLNKGKYLEAADEFLKWNKATVRGKLTVLPGLTSRRAMERALFLSYGWGGSTKTS